MLLKGMFVGRMCFAVCIVLPPLITVILNMACSSVQSLAAQAHASIRIISIHDSLYLGVTGVKPSALGSKLAQDQLKHH
jgi:hypothetical protein